MNPVDWLKNLVLLMGFPPVSVSEPVEDKLGNRWLTIDAANLDSLQIATLIGEGGSGLDALQYLANLLFQEGEATSPYILELDGFRERQLQALGDIAAQAVKHVREFQEPYAISHLSAAERRYIHLLLKEYPDLETFSQGEEPNRKLIVRILEV